MKIEAALFLNDKEISLLLRKRINRLLRQIINEELGHAFYQKWKREEVKARIFAEMAVKE